MFGFLKDKLKQMVKKLTKDVEEQAEEEVVAPEGPEVVEEEPKPEGKEEPAQEEKEPEEKHPIDEFLDEEEKEVPVKKEPTPEEEKKKEPELDELQKEEPEVKEEPAPEVVEEKPEPEVTEEKEEPTPAEPVSEEKKAESLPPLEEKPPEQVAEEAKELVEEAQQVQEEAEETTDVLFEEERPAPAVTEEEQHDAALEKVQEAKKKEEHKKVEKVIEKLEAKEEKKGFFDRIKSVFSKEEETPKAEEEKDVERALLGEGLSEEEKKFVEGTKEKEAGIEPAEEKIGKELAKEEPKQVPEYKPVKEEPEEPKGKAAEPTKEKAEEKKGFFAKLTQAVTTKTLTEKQFDEIFWELEVGLLEANVAVEVIEKIKNDLKESLVNQRLPRSKIEETITTTLSKSIDSLFDVPAIDILAMSNKKKPLTIAFFGVNGAGKTTTIAKFAHWLKKHKKTCVLAAGDTFRAAAIQQLEEHADKLGVKMIKHDYGADSAAVGFDAIRYAEQKGLDVVLIDTAGRLHSNVNLMDELKKIIRVCKPDISLFVGESITGNDCIEQAKKFDEAVGVDGIILTKADVDDKGGTAVSVSFVTKKPILFLGVGQGYDDLKEFDKSIVLGSLELN